MAGAFLFLFFAMKTLAARECAVALHGTTTTVTIPVATARKAIHDAAHDPKKIVSLRIEGISVTGVPDVVYEVYLGLPKGTKPDPEKPSYAGTFSTYGAETQNGAFVVALPLHGAVERAVETTAKELSVTFVPTAKAGPGTIRFTRLRLTAE